MVQGSSFPGTPPQPGIYEYNPENTVVGFQNISSGSSSLATQTIVNVFMSRLGIYTFDMSNIEILSEWYTPVHTSAETLIAALTNHSGGRLSVNEHAFVFIQLAKERLAQKNPPVAPNRTQATALSKITGAASSAASNGTEISVDLSQEEAKSLASFLQGGLTLVVPGDLRPEALSNQADAINQRYQAELSRLPDLLRRAFGGK